LSIQVIPYTEEWVPGVLAFNDRMHATGTHWGWYGHPEDEWIPKRDGVKTWREHWLAVEDGKTVRGAYALKPHEWLVRGEPHWVVDWQGPVTEGLIDRRYNTLGLRLLREMLRQYPLLYSWGHGGLEQPLLLMLEKLGWLLHQTPFCLRILRPSRFLRRNRYLRDTPKRRLLLDAAAFSGAGPLGIRALHAGRGLAAFGALRADATEFDTFGPWADELWKRCAPHYAVVAARDAVTMNTLLPAGGWPRAHKLCIGRDGRTLGWAVALDTQMQNDDRFGSLRVGSVIDCLAAPDDAPAVVGAAFRWLRARGVDLVISNQSHPAWIDAFAKHGFLLLPGRRVFAASPELTRLIAPFAETQRGLHLTNMDGHGPMSL
jgi:hypothetical protein